MSNAAAISAKDAVALALKLSLRLKGRPAIHAEVWSDPETTVGNYIAFKGGKHGSHSLTLKVSPKNRIIAHWEGYATSNGYSKVEVEAALVAAGLKEAPEAEEKAECTHACGGPATDHCSHGACCASCKVDSCADQGHAAVAADDTDQERRTEAVLAEALDQYVNNTEEALQDASEADLADLSKLDIAREKLELARTMLEKLNAKQAARAD